MIDTTDLSETSYASFWQNKKVFITGHTGFKGAWLSIWLNMLGAQVSGYALPPPTQPNLFERANVFTRLSSIMGDVANLVTLQEAITHFQPDIIFHLAAQAIVSRGYSHPLDTYQSNVMGTACLLEAVKKSPATRVVQIVTSDKCYENPETGIPLTENTPFGGKDPYSSSKGCAELVTQAYRHSFFMSASAPSIASVRAGNVIGGGDWAEDRLIPDCIRHAHAQTPLRLRHPTATRPWQFVLEPLSGYLWLAEKQWQSPDTYNEGFNFGPLPHQHLTVAELAEKFYRSYGQGAVTVPLHSDEKLYEATLLELDISKAQLRLDWMPTYTLDQTIERTALWYKSYSQLNPDELYKSCETEIALFIRTAQEKGVSWALNQPHFQ